MFDIKWIRDNPEAFDRGMARRGQEPQAASLIQLDAKRREAETRAQEIQAERNKLLKEVGALKAKGDDAEDLIAKVSATKSAEAEAAKEAEAAGNGLETAMAELPNLPADDVPDGQDEEANKEIRTWGDKPKFDFTPKEHFDIGEAAKRVPVCAARRADRCRVAEDGWYARHDCARLL